MRFTAHLRQSRVVCIGAALGLGTANEAAAATTDPVQISAPRHDPATPVSTAPKPADAGDTSDSFQFSRPPAAKGDSTVDEPNVNQPSRSVAEIHVAFGPQWFWASQKAMTGVMLRAARDRWSGVLETSLIFDTNVPSKDDRRAEQNSAFLGAHFGGYVMASPIQNRRFEVSLGVGVDYYRLWGIHASAWELALAARAAGHLRLIGGFGMFASARVYALSSSGLELGSYRNGEDGLPVLFSTGIEWRLH